MHNSNSQVVMVALWLIAMMPVIVLAEVKSSQAMPNIIVILADDLGYGDLGSYGSKTIATPRIDQLAEQGLRFTQFYAAAPVCTPSRAGLLTGRYPARMGIEHVFMYDSHDGMPQSEITIAEQLKQAGYHTGMVGKWHLGHLDRYMPWNQGFDEFYGVPFSNDMANFFFYENQQILHEPIDQRYLTRRYTEKSIDYIKRHAGRPFFLYLAHSMPHVPLYVSPEFEGQSKAGLYGDVVQELDWSTGQLIDTLRDLKVLDNTLIVFTSDNGPWLAMGDHGGSAGSLRDGKGTTFEGGQRVPGLVSWPNKIRSGRVDDSVVSLVDLMPTFSALAGVPLPADRIIDGNSLVGLLTGEQAHSSQQFFYLESDTSRVGAYRDGDWKLKLPRDGYPQMFEPLLRLGYYAHDVMLFNLKDDPFEKNNVAAAHPDRVANMQRVINAVDKAMLDDRPRELYMRSTASDRKGYGSLFARAGGLLVLMLILAGGVVYGLVQLVKKLFKRYLQGPSS